jgi:predicted nucleotidyltransferase
MPTALELTRKGWKRYLETSPHRPVPPEPTPAEQRERERLLGRVREAAAALKSRFGARRVVLFGSLAHAAWFVPDSDVDLAVEGLIADDYWRAWRLAEAIIGDRLVDLIEIETAGESLRRAIERYGVEL